MNRDELVESLIAVDYWGARGRGPATATVTRMLPFIDAYVEARVAEALAPEVLRDAIATPERRTWLDPDDVEELVRDVMAVVRNEKVGS